MASTKKHTVQILLNAKDEASKVFNDVGGSLKKLASGNVLKNLANTAPIEKMSGALKGLATGAIAATGAALVGLGATAFNVANDLDNASAKLAGSLGLTKGEASDFKQVMQDIYANNFGENFDDIAESIATVNKNMGDMPDSQLQEVTERALAFRDAFGTEVQESTATASVLMEKFGITSEQAFDLIAKGMTSGLNKSDDFLDSINEYSGLFAEGGGSASEFFSLLETGLEGGVLGTDKAADLFKEFSLRVVDGSTESDKALNRLFGSFVNNDEAIEKATDSVKKLERQLEKASNAKTPDAGKIADINLELNAQRENLSRLQGENGKFVSGMLDMEGGMSGFVNSIRTGEITTVDAFQMINNAIAGIEDPIERNKLGVALMGTQFEDMGASAVASINIANTSMDDMAGSADKVNEQYRTVGDAVEGLKRRTELALIPLGNVLSEALFSMVIPELEKWVTWFEETGGPAIADFAWGAVQWMSILQNKTAPMIEAFKKKWNEVSEQALPIFNDAWARISETLGIAGTEFTFMDGVLWAIDKVLQAVIVGLQLTALAAEAVARAIEIGNQLWGQAKIIMGQAWKIAKDLWEMLDKIAKAYLGVGLTEGELPSLGEAFKSLGSSELLWGANATQPQDNSMQPVRWSQGTPQINVNIGNVGGNGGFNQGQSIGQGIVSELRRQGR